MNSDAPSYPYSPLHNDEIRYITILPFNEDVGMIECLLKQAPLGSFKFTALSYVWGDPETTDIILVDGQRFRATMNLVDHLYLVAKVSIGRSPDQYFNYWVDAICINQQDILERNAQVLRIQKIYAQADFVAAWMGCDNGFAGEALEALRQITEPMKQRNYILNDMIVSSTIRSEVMDLLNPILEESNVGARNGIRQLFNAAWWKRIWIVQEAVIATDVLIIWGGNFLDFTTLYLASIVFNLWMTASLQHSQAVLAIFDTTDPLDMINLREKRIRGGKRLLLDYLYATRSHQASDPRDKIYALLGISSDFCDGQLVPDYSLSVRQVYMGFVEAYLQMYKSVSILAAVTYKAESHRRFDLLPTWTPDWTATNVDATVPLPWTPSTRYGDTPVFRASDDMELADFWTIDVEQGILKLKCGLLDTIRAVSPTSLRWTGINLVAEAKNLIQEWQSMLSSLEETYHTTGEPVEQAFRRTLTLDIYITSEGEQRRGFGLILPDDPPQTQDDGKALNFENSSASFIMHAEKRRFAITTSGLMGLVPAATEVGDEAFVLVGGQVPYILRKAAHDSSEISADANDYVLLGDSYIHGMMDGEALKDLQLRDINLR